MTLTDEDKEFVARRARGEYAIDDRLAKIKAAHKGNRTIDDQLYLDFIALALSDRSSGQAEFDRLARIINARHPRQIWSMRPHVETTPVQQEERPSRSRRKPAKPEFKFDDQPRLPSGWDPAGADDQDSSSAGSDGDRPGADPGADPGEDGST